MGIATFFIMGWKQLILTVNVNVQTLTPLNEQELCEQKNNSPISQTPSPLCVSLIMGWLQPQLNFRTDFQTLDKTMMHKRRRGKKSNTGLQIAPNTWGHADVILDIPRHTGCFIFLHWFIIHHLIMFCKCIFEQCLGLWLPLQHYSFMETFIAVTSVLGFIVTDYSNEI